MLSLLLQASLSALQSLVVFTLIVIVLAVVILAGNAPGVILKVSIVRPPTLVEVGALTPAGSAPSIPT